MMFRLSQSIRQIGIVGKQRIRPFVTGPPLGPQMPPLMGPPMPHPIHNMRPSIDLGQALHENRMILEDLSKKLNDAEKKQKTMKRLLWFITSYIVAEEIINVITFSLYQSGQSGRSN